VVLVLRADKKQQVQREREMKVDKKYFIAVITFSNTLLLLLTLIDQLICTSIGSIAFILKYVLRV
jgi:hypothetical protein